MLLGGVNCRRGDRGCARSPRKVFRTESERCSGLWVLSRLLALLRVLTGLGLLGCLWVLSLLRVLTGLGLSCGCRVLAGLRLLGCLRVLAGLGLSCGCRVLAGLRCLRVLSGCGVLAAHGLDGVLAVLRLGLLAVAHDNECANTTDDDDCQDQQEDPLRAGRRGRRGGLRCRGCFAGGVGIS